MEMGMRGAVGILMTLIGLVIVGLALTSWVGGINFCNLWSGAFQAIANIMPFGGNILEIPCPWPF